MGNGPPAEPADEGPQGPTHDGRRPSAADTRVLLEAIADVVTFVGKADPDTLDEDVAIQILEGVVAAMDGLPHPMRASVIAGLGAVATDSRDLGRPDVAEEIDSLLESLGDDGEIVRRPGAVDGATEAALQELLLATQAALAAQGIDRDPGSLAGHQTDGARARLVVTPQALPETTPSSGPGAAAVEPPVPDVHAVPALATAAHGHWRWGAPPSSLPERTAIWACGRARWTGDPSIAFAPGQEPIAATLGIVEDGSLHVAFNVTETDRGGIVSLGFASTDVRTDGASPWFRLPDAGSAFMLRSVRLSGKCVFEIRSPSMGGIHLCVPGGDHVYDLGAAQGAVALTHMSTPVPARAIALDDAGRIVMSGARTGRTRPIRAERAASLGASLRLLLEGDPLDGAAGAVGNLDTLEAWLLPDDSVAVHLTLGDRRFEATVPRESIGAIADGLAVWSRER